jgi:outer membrane beta-barrel protein
MLKHILFVTLGLIALSSPLAWAEEGSKKNTAPAIDEDLSLFWGKRREVKVVQRRNFIKDGKIEALLYGGMIPNDDFIVYYTTGFRVGYHFTESFMVEGSFAKAFETSSELKTYLETSDIGLKRADILEFIQFYYNLNLLWSPIYGKISVLGKKLTHFDTFIGLGVGLFHTKSREEETNPVPQDETKPAANTIIGFRWHITDLINIRTEYRHYFFKGPRDTGTSMPVELNLGVGFKF